MQVDRRLPLFNCIVEHAGVIFDEHKDLSYPGKLTKPMWDTLQETTAAEGPEGVGPPWRLTSAPRSSA